LGLVVVGGVFFSTFLTLIVVPVVYILLSRFTRVKKVEAPLLKDLTLEERPLEFANK
jgi:hypothetical protein